MQMMRCFLANKRRMDIGQHKRNIVNGWTHTGQRSLIIVIENDTMVCKNKPNFNKHPYKLADS